MKEVTFTEPTSEYTLLRVFDKKEMKLINFEKAKKYLQDWWADAAEYSEYEEMNFGQRSNPFENVEAFIVRMVIDGVRTILSRCKFVDDKWNDKFELTSEIISTIKEEVEEQTDDELF